KIFLRCGDEGAYKLIEAYADVSYGLNDKDKPGRGYDLEIVDPAELEVRKMFIETPFHTYYENMENKTAPDKWDLHILILGFDKIGQQTLLQAMSLGVTAPGNRIIADIVDKDMDKLRDSFMNRFAKDAFIETEPGKTYKINNGRLEDKSDGWVEGEVTLRFHREDVRNSRFHADLEKMCEEVPFTYVVVSVNRAEPTTRCLSILHGILAKSPAKVPVYVKMEADDQYRRFVESQQSSGDGSSIGLFSIPGLDFIEDYSTWISFKELNDSGITEVAKLSNKYYGYLYNVFLKPGPFNAGLVSDDDWLKRKLYQRDLTRYGVLYYRNVLDRSLFNAYGDPEEYIRDCFDNDENSILLYDPDDREWDFNPIAKKHEKEWNWSELIKKYKEAKNKETEELLEKVLSKYLNALLEKNEKAWAIIRTEQRRVTNHRISKGWAREDSGNDRDKILKKNPNIMEWNEFLKQHPESVKTNFMCLMMKYESLSKKQA
ncbi:MAG: hypothetical protein II689_00625, partial [Firmicutes bacterium]|nr:hypothetical protein [Bacillota bacterium]